ncbi:MAG TPA: DUF882 domain-containing protein [Kofleriaceae bacterium]|jgi:uncharacterized protein YcbK (DUF882 family)|nr:DUF882 domain-containing protein [Kofleriaceae bacterium]
MLPIILKLKLATAAAAGLAATASPAAMPGDALAMAVAERAAAPIEVKLYDENLGVSATVGIRRDGTTDDATAAELKHLFRCRSTGRQRAIARRTLAMLADLADRYQPRTIEFVSVYRVQDGESPTSPHRDARAIDFRIRGVSLTQIRDYLWRTYTEVGIGWYPAEQFIHMDSRPALHDTAWTFLAGENHYHPYWAEVARRPAAEVVARPQRHRTGV